MSSAAGSVGWEMGDDAFYGPEQAGIHHEAFGRLAERAADLLTAELASAGLTSGSVVDLGCGSGILACRMTDAGYDVVGVDVSEAMLEIARRQAPEAHFVHGSLLDADLPPGGVAVTATGEALNYAVDPRAGDDAFAGLAGRVADSLLPGGAFLFDVSVHGRSGPDRLRVQFHDRPRWSVGVRETEDDHSLTRAIATFRRKDEGGYERTDETHVLRLYDPAWLEATLAAVGFEVEVRPGYEPGESLIGWVVVLARRR